MPIGFYLKARDLVKRYIGFASGVRGFTPKTATCICGSARKSGAHMVTIPAHVIKALRMRGNERVKVLVVEEKRRIIYQLL